MPDSMLDGGSAVSDVAAPEVQKAISEAVAEATRDLTAKVDEFRKNNISLMKRVDSYKDLPEPEKVRQIMSSLENDELGKLLIEGKHEAWFEKRTESMRRDHEQKLVRSEEDNEALRQSLKGLQDKLFRLEIDSVIQREASAAGSDGKPRVNPDAIPLIVDLASKVWHQEEDGLVPRRPDGTRWIGPNGKADITASEWIESLRASFPSLFPTSLRGTGARASDGKFIHDLDRMTPIEKMNVGRSRGIR